MDVYGNDIIIGDFRASDHQCYLASFDSTGDSEDETGIGVETTEEFIADNPVPVYIGQKYSSKLTPRATLTKNPCVTDEDYFNEYECRAILRLVTGYRGYQWMKIVTEDIGEDVWYKVRIRAVSYKKIMNKVAGIILDMECDSQFSWSTEQEIPINAKANTPFYIYNNTDDLYNYTLPKVTIVPATAGNLIVTNQSDDNWQVKFNGVKAGETIIYYSDKNIIDGSRNASGQAITKYLDSSNLAFFRLVPDKNVYVSNLAARFTFTFRVPRKNSFAIF